MKRVYTGKGDAGWTKDYSGKRLAKDHPVIVAGGRIDSLQAALDLVLLGSKDKALLQEVQKKLWQTAGEISGACGCCVPWPVTGKDVAALEAAISALGAPPRKFVRFDTRRAVELNECRVRCRELESACTPLLRSGKLRPAAYRWLNRLSSLFFMLACREAR